MSERADGAEDERTHGLTVFGIIACRGLHVVAAVRRQLGYAVVPVTGDARADLRITCKECRAVLHLEGGGAAA